MKKIWFGLLSGLLVALSLSSAAIAEEVVAEEPAPVVEPAYTPPPEAFEGVGGWAVVDPNTGNVHGVVVCTADVCGPSGSWGGRMPHEYMGCTDCVFRFQTRATADGNVAGWHGTQTEIDSDGNVSQTNDGSVKWNAGDNTFTIENQSVDGNGSKVKRKQKLVPEKTATDGENLSTGIVDIETSFESEVEQEAVAVNTKQETLSSDSALVEVAFENWRKYEYERVEDLKNLTSDVEADLVNDGYVLAGEDEVVEEEPPVFVRAIRELTKRVVEFFTGWI